MNFIYRLLCFFDIHTWEKESACGFRHCCVCGEDLTTTNEIEDMRPSKMIIYTGKRPAR